MICDNTRRPNQSLQPTAVVMTRSQHVYEVRPRKDHRGVDLISDALESFLIAGRQMIQR